jgi:HK97 gp10 family phage protein
MTNEQGKADINRQIKAFNNMIKKRALSVGNNKTKAIIKCVLLVEGTAKRLMTETAINSSIVYWNGKRAHSPSMPGSAPAVDYGTLRRSVTHDIKEGISGAVGRVGSTITNPPYGSYLETGTSRMAARPWLLPAIDINKDEILKILNSVFTSSSSSVGIENAD